MNPGKTKVINFWKGKQQIKSCNLTMNEHKLEVVEKTRFLCLLLKYNLNFNHFEELLNSIKGLYIKLLNLKSKNFKVTSRTIVNLYKTFIRSRFEYSNSAICFLNKSNLQNLEQIWLNILHFALNIQKGIKNDTYYKKKRKENNQYQITRILRDFSAFKGSNTPLYILDT